MIRSSRTRFREDLRTGLTRVWTGSVMATKIAAREADLFRIKLQLDAVERRLARAHRALGEFALDYLLRHDPDLLTHPEVRRLLHEAEGYRVEQRRFQAEVEDVTGSWLLDLQQDEKSSP